MMHIQAFGGIPQGRMYMARCELSGRPTVRVYEVSPTELQAREYRRGRTLKSRPAGEIIARQQRAWFGSAERRLCAPGFAAFGGSERLALESLVRVMREHRDRGEAPIGIGEAIRAVMSRLEVGHASRAAV